MESFHRSVFFLFILVLTFNMCLVFEYAGINTMAIDSFRFLSAAENINGGKGFVVDTLWPLNDGLLPLPQPDFVSQPLYPFLIAFAFKVFGQGLKSAALVNAYLEAANAALTCVLAYKLTRSKDFSLIAGLLYAATLFVTLLVVTPLSESLFNLFAILALILLFGKRGKVNSTLVGVLVGLAYLTHTKAVLLLVAVACFFLAQSGRRGLRQLAVVVAVALLVASPLMYRNMNHRGSPFFSSSQYALFVPDTGKRYQSSIGVPTLFEVLGRLHPRNAGAWLNNATFYLVGLVFDLGSVFVFALMLPGILLVRHYKGVRLLFFKTTLLYFGISFILFSTTLVQLRYLHSFLPVMVVLAVIGLEWALKFTAIDKSPIRYVALFVIVASMAYAGAHNNSERPVKTAFLGSLWLEGRVDDNDVVMGDWPYHADYLLKVNAVQVPSQRRHLKPMVEAYGVTHIIYSPRTGYGVIDGSEDYLTLLYSGAGNQWMVYAVED